MDERVRRHPGRASGPRLAVLITVVLLASCGGSTSSTAPATTGPLTPSTPVAPASPSAAATAPIAASTPTPAVISTPAPSTAVAPTPVPTVTPTFSLSPASEVYVVIAGDTLWDLAQWYDLTLDELFAANPQIADRSLIRVGDEIVIPPSTTSAAPGDGRLVTLDFSLAGKASAFDPRFFVGAPVIFPAQDCRWETCVDWFIGWIQGDDAIVDGPTPVTFTEPVSSLAVRVAPSLQGTAKYTLTALDRGGKVIASTSAIVAQVFPDPQAPFGYFAVELGPLPRPARSFTFEQTNLETPPGASNIEYGMSEISFTVLR